MIRFYNTLTRRKEEFKPIKKGEVKVYSCGPTVYSYAHIGNLRAAIFFDIVKRSLRYFDFKVIDVVNVTDVGHLASDEDSGEDKMLKASKREKKDPYEIARFYEEAYFKNLDELNVIKPKFMPRATDNINEQIDFISKLDNNGFVYKTSDGVYFDVSKLKDYGKLSGQSLDEKKAGARVEVDSDKRNPQDFALWKFLIGDNKNHIMKWKSPWGVGFPGWHIECSAMGRKFLGDRIDIHTGGVDHIPIHHENEIAQNSGSKELDVNFWMHNEFMLVDSEKMSKSLGNVYNLSDIEKKGFDPLAFREFVLRAHYRKQINFTFDSLKAAQSSVQRINEFYFGLLDVKPSGNESRVTEIFDKRLKEFDLALKDDLNTPVALSCVYEFMSEVNRLSELSKKEIDLAVKFMEKVDLVLGLLEKREKVPKEVIKLAKERVLARSSKDYAKSDEIREEIKKRGYNIKDSNSTKEGFILSKLK